MSLDMNWKQFLNEYYSVNLKVKLLLLELIKYYPQTTKFAIITEQTKKRSKSSNVAIKYRDIECDLRSCVPQT